MYTVRIYTDRNGHVIVLQLLLEHHCFSYKDISIIIYYNLCTKTYDIPFIDIHVHCTSLLVVY